MIALGGRREVPEDEVHLHDIPVMPAADRRPDVIISRIDLFAFD